MGAGCSPIMTLLPPSWRPVRSPVCGMPPKIQLRSFMSRGRRYDAKQDNYDCSVSSRVIAIAGVAAFMIANGGDDNPYKEVKDTGKMIDVGTVLEYDAEVTIDNVTKKGTMKMHILGFNPSGLMYKLEMDESLGLPVTEQLMLSNDSSSAKDEKSDEVRTRRG